MSDLKVNSSVAANLGNSGGPYKVTIGEKEITYRLIDQKAKAQFELQLIARAKQDLHNDRDNLSDEDYAALYSNLSDKITTGAYAFGGKIFFTAFDTVVGRIIILSILTGLSVSELEELWRNFPVELGSLFKEICDLSFPQSKSEAQKKTETAQ